MSSFCVAIQKHSPTQPAEPSAHRQRPQTPGRARLIPITQHHRACSPVDLEALTPSSAPWAAVVAQAAIMAGLAVAAILVPL